MIEVSAARTADVREIRQLVEPEVAKRTIISKDAVAYYEALQEFRVARDETGRLVGCGALHVLWEDLAEVRTLAVDAAAMGRGIGGAILERLLEDARELGIERVFCLTFETSFFAGHGFEVIEGTPVEPEVYAELLRSYDIGVAEFLDLERVKPNTLGNTRMLRRL
ncbi:MAG: amino-acid N-acetyltransferase [Austwickia sp.]|nr:amino-acid N-acetyltransferase [Austwickia sp.]MBK8437936.1 amino-acid N-acetyltransferase [Austwickia sp.]MBK9100235.1 amino-acid N-acetyltransferase [Austwickia sp.]